MAGDALKTTEQQLTERKGDTKSKSIATTVRKWFDEAKDARAARDRKFLQQYKIYRFHGRPNKMPWRSDIYIPMGHVNVLVKTAKMLAAIMASDPFFQSRARSMQFAPSEEYVVELMLKQFEDMEWPRVLHDWILDHYIYGLSVLKGYWKYEEVMEEIEETRYRRSFTRIGDEFVEDEPEPYTVTIKKPRVVYDGPAFEVVNIFDFYCDPHATSIKNARYVIHRKDVTIDHLQSMADKGVYDKKIVKRIASERQEGTTDSPEKLEIAGIEDDNVGHAQSNTIEILECVTPTRKIVIGPSDLLLKDGKNPFGMINFFELPHLPDAHKLIGIGVNEPVTKIQKAANKLHNLRNDNLQIHVHKMFVVSENAIRNPSDIVARPGGYIRVKGDRDIRNAIQELTKQPLPMESYVEQEAFERLNETVTGVTEPAKGVERRTGKGETATKTRQAAAGSNTRFGVELILIEPRIKAVLEFMHSLNQTFLDQPRMIRVIGKEGAANYPLIGPQHVLGDYDFKFELAPVQGNSEAWVQRLMLVGKQYSENPLIAAMTNWVEYAQRLAKAAEIRNVGALFGPQFVKQNMLLQMGMQGGPPGTPGGGQSGPATNPQAGALNAQRRMPQPTPGDSRRDIFARVQ